MIKEISYQTTWFIRQKVMWPNHPLSYVKLENDDVGIHYGLFVEGDLTSIVSLFIEGKEAQFRKLATINSQQGKGYGTQLMTYLITKLESMNLKRIWCNARLDKSIFYEKFGMTKTETSFVKGGIKYVIMEKYW